MFCSSLDIAIFDRLYDAAGGHVRLMTLAHELPGAAELATHATKRGVRVFAWSFERSRPQRRAPRSPLELPATHTFNAMRPLDHREPGILGDGSYIRRALFAELICDGIHSVSEMTKLWWRARDLNAQSSSPTP